MRPRNLCSKLLHKWPVRPGRSEGAHVLEVTRREALHLGEGLAQVRGQTVDDLGSPAGAFLAFQDQAAKIPVEQDHGSVGGQDDAQPLLADALLDLAQGLGVVLGYVGPGRGDRERGLVARPATDGARWCLGRGLGGWAFLLSQSPVPAGWRRWRRPGLRLLPAADAASR